MAALSARQSEIVERRLPSRTRELGLFIGLAPALQNGRGEPVTIIIDGSAFEIADAAALLDAVADGAVLMARALVQFLGIGFRDGAEAPYPARGSDIQITDLGLGPCTIATVAGETGRSAADVEAGLKLCTDTANKVSGHLTVRTAVSIRADVPRLAEAFRLVLEAVDACVYRKLGLAFKDPLAIVGPSASVPR